MLGTMTMGRRRLMLATGAALLVGGWGATRFAHEQQQALPSGSGRQLQWRVRIHVGWPGGAGRVIYGAGVASMALGAGLIGFAVLRPTNRNDE